MPLSRVDPKQYLRNPRSWREQNRIHGERVAFEVMAAIDAGASKPEQIAVACDLGFPVVYAALKYLVDSGSIVRLGYGHALTERGKIALAVHRGQSLAVARQSP